MTPRPPVRGAHRWPRMAVALLAATLLASCQAAGPGSPTPTASPTTTSASPTPSDTPSPDTPSQDAPTPTPPAVPTDTRSGAELDEPFTVNGMIVVSKEHPISSRYEPELTGAHGLAAETNAALKSMLAAASADGVRIVVRSGYRSYATQDAILKRKIVEYGDETLARRYNAAPGQSEHQTALAVDLWDGSTWGLGMADTKAGIWLWEHAPEHGFILRYPPGKESITGYAYEPWHFRYVGTEVAGHFGPNSTLTLEEYLGIA